MNSPYLYNHLISSQAFLGRAKEHLAKFDEAENSASLFYAALELRFGIEARLTEYLSPIFRELGKDPASEIEYVGTKLLKRLIKLDPNAEHATQLRITSDENGAQALLEFTPVTPRLASLHGQLGDCLHYRFFVANEHWYLKANSQNIPGRTLTTIRELLQETADELSVATRGSLLGHPRFTELVNEVLENEEEP